LFSHFDVNPPTSAARRNRIKLALIAALFILPIALAWLAHRFELGSGRTANYGSLVAPRAVPDAPLARIDGKPLRLSELRGRWILLDFDAPACDRYCETKLHFMRQLRTALGADSARVERLWLLIGEGSPAPRLLEAIEGTQVARASDALAGFFADGGILTDHIYLIDPLGQWMMRYPRDPDPSRMLKDLQRLMKYSGSG
jgi:cytochrome oxidase Cu insertion factor (SCO1/SenC/PrrC family)